MAKKEQSWSFIFPTLVVTKWAMTLTAPSPLPKPPEICLRTKPFKPKPSHHRWDAARQHVSHLRAFTSVAILSEKLVGAQLQKVECQNVF